MAIVKSGQIIATLDDWKAWGGPKDVLTQWVPNRSAKELARAWLAAGPNAMPSEVISVFEHHAAFGPLLGWVAEPEGKLPFDSFRGEPRNSDLVVLADDQHGKYLIAVEGKADEPFGETVADALAAALERGLSTDGRSKGIARIEQLGSALLGPKQRGEPPVGDLRYQLLTACAGALCEAKRQGVSRAVMLVHEFVTIRTEDINHARNAADLDAFVSRLSHQSVISVDSGRLYGPFRVPGNDLIPCDVDLYLGKVVRNIRDNPPER
ncbi:MAG: hypothetical protein IPF57_09205 [Gammaproteobacteria bacterium]|nr:hypothetical protein [Gammaproteobacteria bacterium]